MHPLIDLENHMEHEFAVGNKMPSHNQPSATPAILPLIKILFMHKYVYILYMHKYVYMLSVSANMVQPLFWTIFHANQPKILKKYLETLGLEQAISILKD